MSACFIFTETRKVKRNFNKAKIRLDELGRGLPFLLVKSIVCSLSVWLTPLSAPWLCGNPPDTKKWLLIQQYNVYTHIISHSGLGLRGSEYVWVPETKAASC